MSRAWCSPASTQGVVGAGGTPSADDRSPASRGTGHGTASLPECRGARRVPGDAPLLANDRGPGADLRYRRLLLRGSESGSYSASATILVRALVGNAYSPETSTTQAATVALQTEAQLVASSQVTDLVRRNLPGTTCNQDLVTAKVLTNTQLIKISAKAASADTARRCAQEYATDYLARRQQVAAAAQTGQLAALTAQLAATEKALATATAVANSPHPPPGAAARVEAESALLAAVQSQVGQLQALSTQPGNLVVAASAAPTASSFSPALAAVAGACLGLLLGMLLAIARERRRRRQLADAEVDQPGLPTLAAISDPGASKGREVSMPSRTCPSPPTMRSSGRPRSYFLPTPPSSRSSQ